MDYQTKIFLVIASLTLSALASLAVARLLAWSDGRRWRVDQRRLNDCKPGCFMMNKGDTE